jgi:N-hydroxyarylamine O-acetyltransferase
VREGGDVEILDQNLLRRYLGILGLNAQPPSLAALREILEHHLRRIPFENLSKLYHRNIRRRRDLVDPATFLEDAERFGFGGTCYALNRGLFLLLSSLGYEVRLCGADMSEPDVHFVLVATLEGREYLVDAGYGGPFYEPIPFGLREARVISLGRDRYEFCTNPATAWMQLAHYRDEVLHHGYRVNPRARDVQEFRDVIAASFEDDATFMNALLVVRFTEQGSEVLHNMRFVVNRQGATSVRHLGTRKEVVELASERFRMPRSIVEELIADLSMRGDP